MAGVLNDNLVYPILDLIRSELRKHINNKNGEKKGKNNHLGDIPSVQLIKEHPKDPSGVVLSAVEAYYSDGASVFIELQFEATANPFLLTGVLASGFDDENELISQYKMTLNYDSRTLLEGVDTVRLVGGSREDIEADEQVEYFQ